MPKYQSKKTEDVYFIVYTPETGTKFAKEIDAYKFAVNNRPSYVIVYHVYNAYQSTKIADFPNEPFWWESRL